MCFCSSRKQPGTAWDSPTMAALNIINLNIDSIQAEVAECKTNIGQETQTVSKGCTNMATGDHTTQNANVQKWPSYYKQIN